MTLEGKQVLIETFNGLLLQDVVDAIPSVQHSYLHLRLVFFLWLGELCNLMLCVRQELLI